MVRAFLFLALWTAGYQTWAMPTGAATLVFSAKVNYPTRLAACGGRIWVYERGTGELLGLSPKTGEILKRNSLEALGEFRQVAALACTGEHLLIAYDVSKKPPLFRIRLVPILDSFDADVDQLPTIDLNTRVQDLFCFAEDCYVLSDNKLQVWRKVVPKNWPCLSGDCFYQSLMSWSQISPPKARPKLEPVTVPQLSVLKSLDVNTAENPFAEWGFQNTQAEGRFVGGDVAPNGALLLLDPFRTQVAKRNEGSFGWWGRWGRWGYWEGRLFFPKGVTYIEDGMVAVLDGALKAVSLFSDAGKFLGLLKVDGTLPQLSWPSDITSTNNVIFVSDSRRDRVDAFALTAEKPKASPTSALSVSLFRRPDFIKDSEADKCLHCHDGTLSDNAHHFQSHSVMTHPIEVEPKKKSDLPLDAKGLVACKTCHDPHHGEFFTNDRSSRELSRPFLRYSAPGLCLKCHDHRQGPNSHPLNAKVSCLNCHEVHGQVHGSLIRRTEKLCLECHQNKKVQHRVVEAVIDTDRAQRLHFESGRVSCNTCHSPHEGDSHPLLKSRAFVQEFCSSCHGPKAQSLYSNFHQLIKKKGVKWTP